MVLIDLPLPFGRRAGCGRGSHTYACRLWPGNVVDRPGHCVIGADGVIELEVLLKIYHRKKKDEEKTKSPKET